MIGFNYLQLEWNNFLFFFKHTNAQLHHFEWILFLYAPHGMSIAENMVIPLIFTQLFCLSFFASKLCSYDPIIYFVCRWHWMTWAEREFNVTFVKCLTTTHILCLIHHRQNSECVWMRYRFSVAIFQSKVKLRGLLFRVKINKFIVCMFGKGEFEWNFVIFSKLFSLIPELSIALISPIEFRWFRKKTQKYLFNRKHVTDVFFRTWMNMATLSAANCVVNT